VTSAIAENASSVRGREPRHADIPRELAALHTRWMSLRESGFCDDVLSRIRKIPTRYYRDVLERAARTVEARLQAEPLPFHLSHGDFTPWNTRCDGQSIALFDWEFWRTAGLPAQDVLHFRFQEMRCVQRRDIERIYCSLLHGKQLRAEVERHLAALGLTSVPVELLFLLYRLDQLADEAAEVRAGVPTFREFALFGALLQAV
jgi:Phosphotransferase enzyme family